MCPVILAPHIPRPAAQKGSAGTLASLIARFAAFRDRHREFLWLACLALLFRVFAVVLFTQGGYLYESRLGTDYQYYLFVGELSLRGAYPSLQYWIEYPPVFSWTIVGLYRLSLLLPAMRDPTFWFHHFLGGFLALVDTGNLVLIYALALRLGGERTALRTAWMYALLFWPLFVMLGWFDSAPLLFLLATVYCLVTNRPVLAGLAAGLGFMTKLIPALAAPAALRALPRRRDQLLCLGIAALVVAAIAAPFLLASPRIFLAGFQAALFRSSWETVWALLEGFFDIGSVAPLETHFDPSTARLEAHPATLPWPLITGAFVVFYLLALSRLRSVSPRATVAFAGLAIVLLFLFSKGYSPQFIVYLLPFVLLVMPDGRGVAFVTLLSLANLLEFPLWAMAFRAQHWVLWVAVGLRTLLYVILAVAYFAIATGTTPSWLARLRDRLALPAGVAAALLVLGLAWPLLDSYIRGRGEYYDLQQYLRPLASPAQGVVLSSRDLVGYVYPFLDGSDVYVLPERWQQQEEQSLAALRAFVGNRPQVWLVLDYSRGEDPRLGFLERTLDATGAKSTNRWFKTFRLVGYVAPGLPADENWRAAAATFDGRLRLDAHAVPTTVPAGSALRVLLRWQTVARVDRDYSLFVHFLAPDGSIVAQRDKVMSHLGAGTASWAVGDQVEEAADLLLPADVPPGTYEIRVGLYRADNGARLLYEGGDILSLGQVGVQPAPVPFRQQLRQQLMPGPK